jgi:enoyl-CoA hydratase/carnithine racemase
MALPCPDQTRHIAESASKPRETESTTMTAAMPRPVPESSLLLRHDESGITTLTLNRPDKFNALSIDLMTAIQNELDAIAADDTIRVVVLAGNGRAFCAGHDLREIRTDPEHGPIKSLFNQCSEMMLTMTRIPQLIIARVHGIATAAGCQLVAMSDLAVASEEARFATSGINVGLFCSTPMVAVTRNLPRKQAMEMLMTGDFIDAETARSYGLVNRVVPAEELDDAIAELAKKIVSKAPVCITLGKELFYRQIEADMEEAYALASETMACNMMTNDARAAIDAFLEKRPMPPWKGR